MKKYKSVNVHESIKVFLDDCKLKTRCKSFNEFFRKVGPSLWAICEEIESEHNTKIITGGFDGDLFIYNPSVHQTSSPVEDD